MGFWIPSAHKRRIRAKVFSLCSVPTARPPRGLREQAGRVSCVGCASAVGWGSSMFGGSVKAISRVRVSSHHRKRDPMQRSSSDLRKLLQGRLLAASRPLLAFSLHLPCTKYTLTHHRGRVVRTASCTRQVKRRSHCWMLGLPLAIINSASQQHGSAGALSVR